LIAREELGRLSEFEIDLLSPRKDIKFSEILAKNVTVRIELENAGDRYFNGFVTRFSQIGMRGRYHLYHASVRPWLWFLTRTADCRIFQKMSVPEIVQKVFADHSLADFQLELTSTYRKWDYCVQYRETDFNFVSRLLEQEGIYYYLRHVDARHTLVLTDSGSSHAAFPGHEQIPYIPLDRRRPEQEAINDWTIAHAIQPGQFVIDDYNFTEPKVARKANKQKARAHELADYEVYDYPGEYEKKPEGDHYVQAHLEEVQSQFELVDGSTNCRGLCTGSTFKLTGHPRADQERDYLVVRATHDLEYSEYESMQGQGSNYGCTFTVMNTEEPFRPARTTPKPIVQGPQTAMVVGPAGDEIYTDEYGRVKVQFHWDRLGTKDENSSCWMRVAQTWAGNNWGASFVPRIGQEVVVSFLEGNADDPLITGSVYNAIQRPPYLGEGRDDKHDNDPHVSGIKSNTTKGGAGFNEWRFDDTKGKEQVFIHGERNYDVRVKNDMMERVLHDRHTIIGGEKDGAKAGDHRIQIYQDRHMEVKRHEVIKIGGNREEFVEGDYDNVVKGTHKEEVRADQHLLVKGKKAEKVAGDMSLTVGTKLQEKVGTNAALEAGVEIHLKAGQKVIVEAGMQITLKVGGNFVDIGPAGVTIQGTMVLINSGGAAGAGSGSSPEAPEAAKEAKPTEPTVADDSKSGSKSCD
ncbi:MAG: tssI, partial [Betaproteobacteria bacterium]|nr:tssI [Betaproteobacteria bacterium]